MFSETAGRLMSAILIATLGVIVASCASMLRHDNVPNASIEVVQSARGTIHRADLVTDGHGLHLHGEFTSIPVRSGPVPGHIDVLISGSDAIESTCRLATIHMQHPRKPRHRFRILIGSVIDDRSEFRVTYHLDDDDHCAG